MSGPGIQIAAAKAPWVMFETRAEEDRAETVKLGRVAYKDVDYALVTPFGSKDQFEFVASEWLERQEQQARENRLPSEWVKAYRQIYKDFKDGRDSTTSGTSLLNWPLITPAQVKLCNSLRVYSIEQLAGANEELIRNLGMGGRMLVASAVEYLEQASGPGKATAELVNLRQSLDDANATLKRLAESNAALAAQVQALTAAVPQAPTPESGAGSGITTADLFDTGNKL